MKNLELKIPPLLLVVLCAVLMLLASRVLPGIALSPVVQWGVSVPVLVLALYFLLFGVLEFRRHKTTVDPRFPQKVSALVDSGVYAVSRNPMYVGFALLLVALVVLLASPWLASVVLLFVWYMNRFQIEPEERVLSALFGDGYVQYQSRVRRWV